MSYTTPFTNTLAQGRYRIVMSSFANDPSFAFSHWMDNPDNHDNTREFDLTANTLLEAVYEATPMLKFNKALCINGV